MRIKELLPLFVISLLILHSSVGGEDHETTFVTPPWNHCLGLHKVTQFHLDIFSGYREKFNDPQGLFCMKLDSEDDLGTKKDDDELTVFGLNSGRHKLIYNKSLTSIGIVGGLGTGLLQFNEPMAVSGDRSGNIFVADTGNNRLVHLKYLPNDELVAEKEITMPEGMSLDAPSGISLSGGLLYTADTGNNRIVVFGTDGSYLTSFRPEWRGRTLYRPTSVAGVTESDGWLYYRDDFIAVVDSMGQRLWKISPQGKALEVVHYYGIGDRGGFNHVAIDYYANMYTTDSENNRIHKFDRHLNYITAIGRKGNGKDQFDEPRGITIYRRFGQVFISERAGAQYYWIGTDLLRLETENLAFDVEHRQIGIDVSFLLTEHATVSLSLENEKGEHVFTILEEYMLPAGKFTRRLELACEDAEALAKCKLRLIAVAKPTYSSRAFLAVARKGRFLRPRITSNHTFNNR